MEILTPNNHINKKKYIFFSIWIDTFTFPSVYFLIKQEYILS